MACPRRPAGRCVVTRQSVRKPARTAAGAVIDMATREAALRTLSQLGALDTADALGLIGDHRTTRTEANGRTREVWAL